MPLMRELGILWQTGAISPSHEHFITNLLNKKFIFKQNLQRKKPFKVRSSHFCFFCQKMKFMNLVYCI